MGERSEQYVASRKLSKKEAQVVGEVLEKILRRDGEVTASAVVQEAKSKRSPLHPYFTWEWRRAAEERWLDQARELIRSVHVVFEEADDQPPIRAFAKIVRENGNGYQSMDKIMRSTEWRQQLVTRALEELRTFESRYKNLTELAEIFSALDKVRKKVVRKAA